MTEINKLVLEPLRTPNPLPFVIVSTYTGLSSRTAIFPLLKIYQCQKCNRVFRHEADREEHCRSDGSHQSYREYELETFLTRFLVA